MKHEDMQETFPDIPNREDGDFSDIFVDNDTKDVIQAAMLVHAMNKIKDPAFHEELEKLLQKTDPDKDPEDDPELCEELFNLVLSYLDDDDIADAYTQVFKEIMHSDLKAEGDSFMKEIEKICASRQSDKAKLQKLDDLEKTMLEFREPLYDDEDRFFTGDRHPFDSYLSTVLLGPEDLDIQSLEYVDESDEFMNEEQLPYGYLYAEKAKLYERLRMPEKAIEALEEAALHLKGDASVRLALVRLYLQQNDLVSAYDHLQEAYNRIGRLSDLQQFWLLASRFFKKSGDETLMLYAAAMADTFHALPKKERIAMGRTGAFNKEKLLSDKNIRQEFSKAIETPGIVVSDELFNFLVFGVAMLFSLEDYENGTASLKDIRCFGWDEYLLEDNDFRKIVRRIGRIAKETSLALADSPFGEYYAALADGDTAAADTFKNS